MCLVDYKHPLTKEKEIEGGINVYGKLLHVINTQK